MNAICAACGVELEPGRGDGRSVGLGVFFRGRRYDLCSVACRMAFKRDPEGAVAKRPEAGRAPAPEGPAPSARKSPFTVRGGSS